MRADLERLQWKKGAAEAANREYEAMLERLRKERSLGTSFDGQGGCGSADCRGTAATTKGSMWIRGVPAVVWGKVCRMFLGVLYQNSPWNALPTFTSLGSDVSRFL